MKPSVLLLLEDPEGERVRRYLESLCLDVNSASDPGEALALAVAQRPAIAVLQMSSSISVELVLEMANSVACGIIAVADTSSEGLIRLALKLGFADFFLAPVDLDRLGRSVLDMLKMSPHLAGSPRQEKRLGRVITVFSTKGGVGKSTISANVGAALYQMEASVCVIDLDLEFGCQAALFGIKPHTTIVNLCHIPSTLTPELCAKALLPVQGKRMFLLAAPPSPELAAEVEGEGRKDPSRNYVREIIEAMRESFDYVIIDTASNFRETNLTALDLAETVILVTTPDIPALQNTAKSLDILTQTLRYSRRKVHIALNRADGTLGLTYDDISKSLDFPISFYIPSDGPTAIWAANCGQPFVWKRNRSPLSKAIAEMAGSIQNMDEFTPPSRAPSFPKKGMVWGGF